VESVEKRSGSMMKRLRFVIGLLSLVIVIGHGQSIRSLVNGGNSLYEEKKFADAEVNYRKALERDITTVPGHFNLGNSLYKQNKYDESLKSFQEAIAKAETKSAKAQAYYNLGNGHLKASKYEDAIKSYTESLKLNPNDQDAKYNLSYAMEKLKQQQEQQKNQKNNDKNQDKNKDKQDQDKQNQDQNKQDQQKQDQEKQQQDQQQNQEQQKQQQPQQQKQMSKADAERILDVLKNNEKDVQKKLRQRVAGRPKSEKDW
jgi:Ca-activated chloride channel family protein